MPFLGAFLLPFQGSFPGYDRRQQERVAAGVSVQSRLAAKDDLRAVGRIVVQERPAAAKPILEVREFSAFSAPMKRDRNGTAVRVIPPFVASCLTSSRETRLSCGILKFARCGARPA